MSKTYSTTIEITEEKEYSVTINAGLDLSAWISAGSTTDYPLNPSSYADFSALEADEAAIRQLMTVHASVDYLAQATAGDSLMQSVINSDICAKWINLSDYALDTLYANSDIADEMDTADKYGYGEWGLVGQVPVLSSNTGSNGVASASVSNSNAYIAFDGNDASTFDGNAVSGDVQVDFWIQYTFNEPTCIKKFHVKKIAGDEWLNGQLLGSNDGFVSDTHTLATFENGYFGEEYIDEIINNDTTYTSYRFTAKAHRKGANYQNNQPRIYTMQFLSYAPLGNVPIMTANNAPYGVVSRNSVTGSNEAYKAFSGSATATDRWLPNTNDTNNYLRYTFVNPVKAKKAKINFRHSPSLPQMTFSIRASNDGFTTYDTVGTVTVEAQSSAGNVEVEVDLTSNTYYMAYDLFCSTAMTITSYDIGVHSLQFYGRELKPLVPTMTANDKPKGEVISSSEFASGYEAYHAFNGNLNVSSLVTSSPPNGWLGYKFPEPVIVKSVQFKGLPNTNYAYACSVTLKKSADGENYTNIDTISLTAADASIVKTFDISSNADVSLGFRMDMTGYNYYNTNTHTGYTVATYLQFYGMDYSEKEFAQGSTRKTIYDHGVELVDLGSPVISSGVIANKNELGELYINIPSGSNLAGAFMSANTINFTDYDYLKGIIGTKLKMTNPSYGRTQIGVKQSRTYSYSDSTMLSSSGIVNSSNQAVFMELNLDISSVNGDYYFCMGGGESNGIIEISMKEIWIE